MNEELILSVSDCIALVNQTLEYAYPSVIIEGEVASFKVSKEKYVFFDIKDDTGILGCFMMIYQLRLPLENGMKVRITGQPRLTAWGKFSLTVRDIRPVGEGSIKRSLDLLKSKLQKEGLFDISRKRLLPSMPEKIGLIASVESAGYADFLKILHQRWGGVEVVVADVQVQGVAASSQIERALQYFNEHSDGIEVLVVVRGGGSAEDLAVFNDEPLVRAVASSRIPTLIGVGHEVDTSLSDLVADVRAATPSNAAQLLVPDRQAIMNELAHKKRHLVQRLSYRAEALTARVNTTAERLLSRMQQVLNDQARHVAYIEKLLRQLDPKTVLRRGYALVRDQQGHVVTHKVRLGDKLQIELNRVILDVGVNDVRSKE